MTITSKNLTNENPVQSMVENGSTVLPSHFSLKAQREVGLLFDQLNAYFAHKAQKYVDPVSKAIFSASPAVVVEFDGIAIPVCAVKHSSKKDDSSDIVFYEYSPQGRHIGTLFVDSDGQIVVVNSQDPRTIDFSDIKPHEIRDFVGALAIAIEGQKWVSRFRSSLGSLRSAFRRVEIAEDVEVHLHNIKLPVEVSPHASRLHRMRAGLKKFVFRHPILSTEVAALGLSLAFQSLSGAVAHHLDADEPIYQLDQSAQIDISQDLVIAQAQLTSDASQKLDNFAASDHLEVTEHFAGDNGYAHAYMLDRNTAGRALAVNAPNAGKCVSLLSDEITSQSHVYIATPKNMSAIIVSVNADTENERGVNRLITMCNVNKPVRGIKQENGGHLAIQIGSRDELRAQGVDVSSEVRTLAIAD